jgi:hypothetical protein
MERLSRGIKGKSAKESGRLEQSRNTRTKQGTTISLGNTHSNSTGEEMVFNTGETEVYYPLSVTG